MEPGVNEAEWQSWVEEHTAKFLLFARQAARSEADAQDLVQEAVVSVGRSWGGCPPPLPAVFAAIRRRAIDLARREDRRAGRERAVAEGGATRWFDASAEDREMKSILEEAMRQLPAIYREVITLKIWGGLTFAEVGQAVQVSPNTAASRYRYGLEELRKLTRGVLA